MKDKISPSMMCVDFFKLEEALDVFEEQGIELLHIDIMDGNFVPNITLGTDFCKSLKERCNIPLDIHLMVEKPEEKIDWFNVGCGDYISVHLETTKHLQRTLNLIKQKGCKAMVAINPATPIYMLENVLDDIDGVLIMSVNPGFSGQKLIPQSIKKIEEVRRYLDDKGYNNIEIEVDGNVSFENVKLMKFAGANIFVAGTSSIFNKNMSINEGIRFMRECLVKYNT